MFHQSLFCGWAVLLLQATAALCQFSPSPNGGSSFNLTPQCRSGSAGTLSFNGGGVVNAVPDTATVSVTINGNGTTAAEARDLSAEVSSKVFTALTQVNGITPSDLTTTYVSVTPQTNYNSVTGASVPDGFAFSNSLSVQVNNVSNAQLAEVLDAVVKAGGDSASINGVSLSLSPGLEHDLTNEARRIAVADAQATGALYAEELGVTLGSVLSFTDNSASYSDVTPATRDMTTTAVASSVAQSTPVELGTQPVSVSVTVVYSICSSSKA